MTERGQIYKCNVCGNIVEVLHPGPGELVCCNRPMEKLEPQTADAALEKHVPVVELKDGETLVKVGSIPHPMTEKHYIEWIEVITIDDRSLIKFLTPDDKPEATFRVTPSEIKKVREYCNIHGLWATK